MVYELKYNSGNYNHDIISKNVKYSSEWKLNEKGKLFLMRNKNGVNKMASQGKLLATWAWQTEFVTLNPHKATWEEQTANVNIHMLTMGSTCAHTHAHTRHKHMCVIIIK